MIKQKQQLLIYPPAILSSLACETAGIFKNNDENAASWENFSGLLPLYTFLPYSMML